MFVLSVVMAGSDVAIDRATVIAGDEEARATGRSRATTVGLNQAICWLAIYGSGIVAALLGGYATDHVPFKAPARRAGGGAAAGAAVRAAAAEGHAPCRSR